MSLFVSCSVLLLVWTNFLPFFISCTCYETRGNSYDYDYNDGETFHENSIELRLCCNRTTIVASWIESREAHGVKYVSILEYSCSDNQVSIMKQTDRQTDRQTYTLLYNLFVYRKESSQERVPSLLVNTM